MKGGFSGASAISLAFFLLLVCFPGFGADGSPDSFEEAKILVDVSGSGTVLKGSVRSINFTTNLFPKGDERQEVSCSKGIAPSGFLEFYSRGSPKIEVGYSCTVTTKTYGTRISGTEKYPLDPLTGEFSQFLSGGEKVLLTPEIRRLSSELVSGETTELGALVRIGEFVNKNITYDSAVFGSRLDTEKILSGKKGVCEEFAHLFIALSRSAGIPARYVGGFAWGGRGTEGFGSHGWAEAYFPGKGWVPFDPTSGFAQWGWLDTSHIKFYSAPEAAKTVEQVSYEFVSSQAPEISWSGVNPTNPSFSLIDGTAEGFMPARLTGIFPSKSGIFEGEAFLINATVRNALPTAIGAEISPIYLARNLEESENLVLLFSGKPAIIGPEGSGNAVFVLSSPKTIGTGYYYEYPIGASVLGEPSGEKTLVKASSGSPQKSPEIFPDYGIFYGAPGRQEFLLQPESGLERPFKFPISSGKMEVSLRGFKRGWVFSSTGSWFYASGETPEVSVIAPKDGYVGEDLELAIYSEEDVSATYEGKEYKIPKGTEGRIPIGPTDKYSVSIRLINGTVEQVVGTVRRIPKPSVSISIPLEIRKGGETVSNFAVVSNGKATYSRIKNFPEKDSGYFVSGEPCSQVGIEYEVEYEDSLGRKGKTEGTVSSKISCGRSPFFQMLSDFFSWLFGK